ncbi:hypothetical protein [Winogradskyella thalassocola]|uniref:Lipocalin-like domain-containing protein n=1 Tax=Winogradskyella thalassocola TaxID=262004 RepID=A0A1G8B3X5_9FLAO|nr:hypothetical protein [Winogradskyella thalassocola]SDH27896.1 hypothetical protein SAMN04489796_102111 [Winogradskyella thalassocola]
MRTKLKNVVVFVCVLCFMACSSDDDNSDSDLGPEGTWLLTSLSVETAFDFNTDGTATRDLFEETPCYDGDFVSFESEGEARVVSALTFISPNVISATDYSYDFECLTGFDVETNWSQSGNTVTIQLQGNDVFGTITGNTLTVFIPNFFQMELYNGTDYYDVTEDVTLIYIKE